MVEKQPKIYQKIHIKNIVRVCSYSHPAETLKFVTKPLSSLQLNTDNEVTRCFSGSEMALATGRTNVVRLVMYKLLHKACHKCV